MRTELILLQIFLMYLFSISVCGQQSGAPPDNASRLVSTDPKPGIREDIFIHTDRDEYIAGEYMWCAAYIVNRGDPGHVSNSRTAYIELTGSNNNPVVQKIVRIADGAGHQAFMIPDTVSSGVYTLRAYTNLMKNFPVDQCFMKTIFIYNVFGKNSFNRASLNGEPLLPGKIHLPQLKLPATGNTLTMPGEERLRIDAPGTVERREKISIDIFVDKSFLTSGEKAKLSISVSAAANGEEPVDIIRYLSAMSTGGSDSANSIRAGMGKYLHKSEEEGRYLGGRIIGQIRNGNQGGKVVLLSIPGKKAYFQYALTDNNGNFSFYIFNDTLTRDLVLQVEGNNGSDLIRLNSTFWESHAGLDPAEDTSLTVIPGYISEWSENYQVGRVYGTKPAGEEVSGTSEPGVPVRFYGKPDFELQMADYILLPDMREVFFELIPGVSLKTGRTLSSITVSNPRDNKNYDSDPVIMIDGVIVSDASLIAGMNPEIVERIEVVRTEYIVGGYHFYGIVNVITKNGNFSSVDLPENAIRLPYRTYEPEISFVSPDYSSPQALQSRVPDYRNTLYWNPAVETDEDGKARIEFRASDFRSDFEINIQGMTTDGKPLSAKKLIRVE